ncbi:MAG: hypothetical protein QXD73_04895 [Candidatus Bathyarchaeia archaeon]
MHASVKVAPKNPISTVFKANPNMDNEKPAIARTAHAGELNQRNPVNPSMIEVLWR